MVHLKICSQRLRSQNAGDTQADGQMSTKTAEPDVMANHLADKVWNHHALPELPLAPLFSPAPVDTSPFTESELLSALALLKNRKAPGPDQLPAEIWKYAPRSVHLALLAHFNTSSAQAVSPRAWKVAERRTPPCLRVTAPSLLLTQYIYV